MPEFLKRRFHDLEMTLLRVVGILPVHRLRVLTIQLFGGRIASTATVYHGFEIRAARNLEIGERSSIGNGAILDARGGLVIGSDVNLSTDVHIWTGQHAWDDPDFAYVSAPVRIGDRVWLSTRVTVLPGVVIGDEAVVAAGAVVTKDVPAHALVAGVPARVVGTRRQGLRYQLPPARRKSWWW